MNTHQAAYRAGCIVREVEERLAGDGRLSPACLGNCSRMPNRIHVYLRHLWGKATKDEVVAGMLEDFDPPDVPYPAPEQGSFWIGYYHQATARKLPEGFGNRLQSLRESRSMTREDLADAAGITRQSLHNYETGARRPTWDAVQAIASALGVPTDTFRDA